MTELKSCTENLINRLINDSFCDDTTTSEKFGRLVTNIVDYNKFLPKLSQNLLENLNDEEYYDITIEVGNDSYVKIFRAQ